MPHSALDERLHRYFDDPAPLEVPGSPEQAVHRARSRRRHQILGFVGCVVVVLAALGVAGSTLLGGDDESSGPVAIEGGQESSGLAGWRQTWIDLPARDGFTPTFLDGAWLIDGGIVADVEGSDADGRVRTLWTWSDGEWTRLPDPPVDTRDFTRMGRVYAASVADGTVSLLIPSDGDDAPTRIVEWEIGDDSWSERTLPFTVDDFSRGFARGDGFFVVVVPDGTDDFEVVTLADEPTTPIISRVHAEDVGAVRAVGGQVWVEVSEGALTPTRSWTLSTTDGATWTEYDPMPGGEAELVLPLGANTVAWLPDVGELLTSMGTSWTPGELSGFEPDDDQSLVVTGTVSDGASALVVAAACVDERFTECEFRTTTSSDGETWERRQIEPPGEGAVFAVVPLDVDGAGRRALLRSDVLDSETSGLLLLEASDSASSTSAPVSEPEPSAADSGSDPGIGLGPRHWISLPPIPDGVPIDASPIVADAEVDGEDVVAVIRWWKDGVVAEGLWRWSDGWAQIDPGLETITGMRAGDGEVLVVGTSGGRSLLVRSSDGGATWSSRALPVDGSGLALGDGFVATLDGGEIVALADDDLSELSRVEWDDSGGELAGSVDLREADSGVWALETGPWDGERAPFPQRILSTADGRRWSELDAPDDGRWIAAPVDGAEVWLGWQGGSQSIVTPSGTQLAADEVVGWVPGDFQQLNLYDLRGSDRGAVILGSFAASQFDQENWLLASYDGESWQRVDLPLPSGKRSSGILTNILDLAEDGKIVVDLDTYFPNGRSAGTLLVVEPQGSDSPTSRARARADAFLEAWREGDRERMLELSADPRVVDNTFAIAGPVGEFSRCQRQSGGQFECFVDTTGTYEAYIQVGDPGTPDGPVTWVAPAAD